MGNKIGRKVIEIVMKLGLIDQVTSAQRQKMGQSVRQALENLSEGFKINDDARKRDLSELGQALYPFGKCPQRVHVRCQTELHRRHWPSDIYCF